MTTEMFDFYSPKGHVLSGRLEVPDGVARGWAMFAHCFTCGKGNLAASRIGRSLAASGIGVLRFDFAGLGASQGDFADGSLTADIDDLIAGANALSATGRDPELLVGHSLGERLSLWQLLRSLQQEPSRPSGHPWRLPMFSKILSPTTLRRLSSPTLRLARQRFRVRKTFVDDLRTHDLAARLSEIRRPILVLHAPSDSVVGIDHEVRIFEAASHAQEFCAVEQC